MASKISSAARSQQESAKNVSFLDKLAIVPTIPVLIFKGIYATFFVSKSRRAPTRYVTFVIALLRAAVSRFPHAQRHSVLPTDDEVFHNTVKKFGQELHEIIVEGTTTFWIGSKDADYILLNFHGGGFSHPHADGQVEYLCHAKKLLDDAGKNVAILSLAYDLTPVAAYPRQLQQAAQLVSYLVHDLRKSPSNIVLIGDSAGANLVLALLSHIIHPHPTASIPSLDTLAQDPFRSAVLVSPWITFKRDLPSMRDFELKDVVSWSACCLWASAYFGTTANPAVFNKSNGEDLYPNSDNYVQARDAPANWWTGLSVKEIRVLSGGDECLVDPIVEFTNTLRSGYGADKIVEEIVPGECHEAHYLLPGLGVKETGMGAVSDKWLLELFP